MMRMIKSIMLVLLVSCGAVALCQTQKKAAQHSADKARPRILVENIELAEYKGSSLEEALATQSPSGSSIAPRAAKSTQFSASSAFRADAIDKEDAEKQRAKVARELFDKEEEIVRQIAVWIEQK